LAEEFGPEWAMQHIIPQVSLSTVKNVIAFYDELLILFLSLKPLT
jgi:hypothetical protein